MGQEYAGQAGREQTADHMIRCGAGRFDRVPAGTEPTGFKHQGDAGGHAAPGQPVMGRKRLDRLVGSDGDELDACGFEVSGNPDGAGPERIGSLFLG